ncbi:MAG: hypothetical protein RSE41_10405 [Clostridia bacterium]
MFIVSEKINDFYKSYNISNRDNLERSTKGINDGKIRFFNSLLIEKEIDDKTSSIANILEKEKEETKKYKLKVEKYEKELLQKLKYFDCDSDEISFAEMKILEIARKENFTLLGEVIQGIYIKYNDNPKYLIGLCTSLQRYDYDEVIPWGQSMLLGVLNHRNTRVKEAAVLLVENWAVVEFLPALKNLECKEEWLQNYINKLIEEIEG